MDRRKVDVVILGAGTAGMAAYRSAVRAGANALLVDPGPLGTTCARSGCMPSKLLLAGSRRAAEARAQAQGAVGGEIAVGDAAVLDDVRRGRDGFVDGVLAELRDLARGRLLLGRARLAGTTTLVVEPSAASSPPTAPGEPVQSPLEVEARAVVVATGTRAIVPKALQALGDRLYTEESIFELHRPPPSMAVVGGGAIGLELGQAFARLGTRVLVVESEPRLSVVSDHAVEEALRGALRRELDLRVGAQVTAAHREGDRAVLTLRHDDGTLHDERVDAVLVAAGRRPRIDGMGLEELGLPLERGAPRVDPLTLQWGDAPVFFAGDVTQQHPVLHEAATDGDVAGRNAARYPHLDARPRRTALSIVFTEPTVAIVGPRWSELARRPLVAGSASYDDQGRAKIEGQARGLLRLFADRETGVLLGAELCAPAGEHLAHWLALAVHAGLTAEAALGAPFYHPTVEEGLRTALRDLCKNRDREQTSALGPHSLQ